MVGAGVADLTLTIELLARVWLSGKIKSFRSSLSSQVIRRSRPKYQ
jgi:hypothetical protein